MAATQTTGIPNQPNQATRGPATNAQPARVATAPGPQVQNTQKDTATARNQLAVAPQSENALVPVSTAENADVDTNTTVFGAQISRLPVELDVSIPLRDFRVKDLLALEPGRLVESEWSNGVDLPLSAGKVQLAWSEFEVIETQLVVRLTRLA